MFEHLSNCHGEWNALMALIGSIPFIGVWFRTIVKKKEFKNSRDHLIKGEE